MNQVFNQLVFLHHLILHGLMKMENKRSKISVVSIIVISVQMKLIQLLKKMVMPRSYLSREPACLRASRNEFDPIKQIYDEIKHT